MLSSDSKGQAVHADYGGDSTIIVRSCAGHPDGTRCSCNEGPDCKLTPYSCQTTPCALLLALGSCSHGICG